MIKVNIKNKNDKYLGRDREIHPFFFFFIFTV
jgi:hypothetical protein